MKNLLSLFFVVLLTLNVSAQVTRTVAVTTPGTLATLTSAYSGTVSNLTVTGNIDARDVATMRDAMPLLSVLDISGVSIKAYTGIATYTSSIAYAANEIPSYSFYNASSRSGKPKLISIVLPTTITKIGDLAFQSCTGLTSITLPASVTTIGFSIFSACSNLNNINVESSSVNFSSLDGVLFNKNKTTLIQYPVGKVGSSYVIPSGVTTISDDAFMNSGLTSITIPASVTNVGSRSFYYNPKLTEINVENDNLNFISQDGVLFDKNKTALIQYPWSKTGSSFSIPTSVVSIGGNAFYHCSNLTSVSIPSSVTSIGSDAFFQCDALTSISIPSAVKSIGSRAFGNCSELTSINVESGNQNYSSVDGVLFDKNLTSLIQYPNGKTTISYSIPATVTSIDTYGFYFCSRLVNLTIPSSVTSIGNYAFYACKGLSSIYMNSKPLVISATTFSGVNTSSCILTVPYSTQSLYTAALYWLDFIIIEEPTTGFVLDTYNVNISANTGSTNLGITANVAWTASSDQSWLTVKPGSGTGSNTFTLEAQANETSTERTAIVTVSSSGLVSQTITVKQDGNTVVTPGGLFSLFSADELLKIKNLTLSGSIDARDFKTMRDKMPLLANLDLSAVTIAEYNGISGTSTIFSDAYPANEIPVNAFYIASTGAKVNLTSVVLPESTNSIGNSAFYYCYGLTSMVIPNSVTSIGNSAFYNCYRMASVTIPSKLSFIGDYAFMYCNALTAITIPASVTTIGNRILTSCAKLSTINVESGNPFFSSLDGILFNKNQTALIQYPGGKIDSIYAIPNSVTSIGSYAFYNCTSLTKVTISNSVTAIGSYTFYNCTGLKSVSIPNSISTIPNYAFQNCSGLTSIFVNSIPLVIYTSTFYGVNTATCVLNVPYNTKKLYAITGSWSNFVNIVEPTLGFLVQTSSLKMPANAGSTMVSVAANTSISISSDQSWLSASPNSGTGDNVLTLSVEANQSDVSRIGIITVSASGLFPQTITVLQDGLSKTINVTAGNLATVLTAAELSGTNDLTLTGSIDARDFKTMRDNMPVLARIDLSGVNIEAYKGREGTYSTNITGYPANEVPIYAFNYAASSTGKSSFISFVMPKTTKSIGDYAFYNCKGLVGLIIPDSVTTIGHSAFANCDGLTSINIPASVTSIGPNALSHCTGITEITVESGNKNYISLGGVLYDINQTTIIQYPNSKTGSSYNIPSSVTTIADYAFSFCLNLTTIAIPTTVTTIGNYAFFSSNHITNMTIPSSVTSIGSYAFGYCSGLTSMIIPKDIQKIGSYAFYYCSGLTSIYANAKAPLNFGSSTFVFNNVDKTTCKLYVPVGSKAYYQAASQWKDFANIVEFTTAVPALSAFENVRVFPNPVIDKLTIQGLDAATKLRILDLNGRVMMEKNLNFDTSISLKSLLSGHYILQVSNSNGVKCYKIVKQ